MPRLYTLAAIAEATGINPVTLSRYAREYADRIPSEGEGRKRRYPAEAAEVFLQLKREGLSRKGRPRKSPAGLTGAQKRGLEEVADLMDETARNLSALARRLRDLSRET